MSENIHITDLAEPELSELQKSIHAYGETLQVSFDASEMMQQTLPNIAAMHPMNPNHIHEELELMGPDFASYNFEWLCQCPRWRDHYYASDQTPHYEYMKTVLKILTWQDGDDGSNTRWVLKCPQHPEQLTVLHKVFPDATIAVTHRHQAINYVHDETVKGMNEGKDVHTLMSEIPLRQQ